MTLKTFRRMIEAFFRRWPIYVAILIGSISFGIMTISGTEELYTSRGTVFVESQSLVTSQSGVASPAAFSYLTAAQTTSDQLRGLLQTDIFLASVVDRADADLAQGPSIDLDVDVDDEPFADSSDDDANRYNLGTVRPPPDPLAWADQATEIRESINIYAVNENLMSIDATTADPELSHKLSVAIIEELVQFQITLDVAESAASEDFFLDLAGSYERDVIDTRQAVDEALRRIGPEDEVSGLEQREIDRLREAEVLAVTKYRGALDEVELARLLSLQTQTDIQQSFSVFDPPRVPTEPDQSLVGELRILISAAAVGLALALVLPIVIGLLQRTVLFADDLEDVAPVLSVVPKVRRSALRLPTGEAEESDAAPVEAVRPVHEQATQTLTYDSADLDVELESVDSSSAEPSGSAGPPTEAGQPVGVDDLLAEIEGSTANDNDGAPDPGQVDEPAGSADEAAVEASEATEPAPTDQAPEGTEPATADEGEQLQPADGPQEPGSGAPDGDDVHSTAVNGTHDSTDSNGAGPSVDGGDEPSQAERLGTQTGTFLPIEVGPVAAPAPPDRLSPPAAADTVGVPSPPNLPLPVAAEPAGAVDPTVTAEISAPVQHPRMPPTEADPPLAPGDDPSGLGFTVQARSDGDAGTESDPANERATASDSGSETDETTETNLA